MLNWLHGRMSAAVSAPPPGDDYWYKTAGGTAQTTAGVVVGPDIAMTVSAVYACVYLISGSLALLPFKVLRSMGDNRTETLKDHNAHRLLNVEPNPWQTAYEFREMMTGHLALRGNCYAEKVQMPGVPLSEVGMLVPLHPDNVTVVKDADGAVMYRIAQDFGDPTGTRTLTDRVVEPSEVMHLRLLSTDGFTGLSPIAAHRSGIGLAIGAETMGATLFGNGASPRGIIETDRKLDTKAVARLRASWEQAHSGANKQNRVAVLEGGLKWKQVGLSPDDAQFLQTRRFQVEDIARVYGVPPHMIGSMEKNTAWGTGIEQLNIGFVTWSLAPWVARWEQTCTRDLVDARRDPDVRCKINVNALLRGDVKTRFEAYEIAVRNGWLSPNEVRQLEDLNPRAGGDEYTTDASTDDAPASTPPAQPGAAPPFGNEDEDEPEDDSSAQALARAFVEA